MSERCDVCGGVGFMRVEVSREPGQELQRCDLCDLFEDDDAAAVAFVGALCDGQKAARDIALLMVIGVMELRDGEEVDRDEG